MNDTMQYSVRHLCLLTIRFLRNQPTILSFPPPPPPLRFFFLCQWNFLDAEYWIHSQTEAKNDALAKLIFIGEILTQGLTAPALQVGTHGLRRKRIMLRKRATGQKEQEIANYRVEMRPEERTESANGKHSPYIYTYDLVFYSFILILFRGFSMLTYI